MTEQEVVEAIKFLKGKYPLGLCDRDEYENTQIAIKALEITQELTKRNTKIKDLENYIQFEDECVKKGFNFTSLLEAREKQIAKKTMTYKDTNRADCPCCNAIVRGIKELFGNWCSKCGQELDWSE